MAAIKSIIEARHKIGAETKDTLEKWNNIEIYKIWDRESDARKKDIVLIELEKRKDGAFVGQSSSSISKNLEPNH